MICDDETAIREILARLVRREGYEPLQAADGLAAVAAIRENAPDALFLDIRMPGIDGIEVLRQVKQLAPKLPIVIITSSIAAADAALGCGAHAYLLKPFRHEDVIRSLEQALDERGLQPAPPDEPGSSGATIGATGQGILHRREL